MISKTKKKQKKIVIFIPSIEGGGVEKNLFIISNFLSKKLSKVYVSTTNHDMKYKFDKKISFILPNSKQWQKKGRFVKTLISLWNLFLFWLKDKNFIILSFQANIYSIIFGYLFNIKVISRSNSAPEGWSKNIFKRKIFKIILKLANTIIVNSYDFKKSLDSNFDVNSVCIYNPLDRKNINKLSNKRVKFDWFKDAEVKLINVARFTDQKDHITLLKSIKGISNNLKFKLLIIGRGKNFDSMKNYIQKNNINSKVKIIKFKKNPYPYIKLADVFILSSRFEGLPNVLLEAMQLKKFIISTKCPTGPREILKNGQFGKLVKVGDVKSLSKSINFYIANRQSLNKKIKDGFKSLNRFNYEKNLIKYYNCIKKIL